MTTQLTQIWVNSRMALYDVPGFNNLGTVKIVKNALLMGVAHEQNMMNPDEPWSMNPSNAVHRFVMVVDASSAIQGTLYYSVDESVVSKSSSKMRIFPMYSL
eukprot:NODE_2093_length_988_cov_272.527157_g278_i1.p1 GENE.NODE_2093_length_988_cov_272.527157_g278_i1~~NODE_2093_length_988_cov_272.527157_g278_i1.p1  ORF type:complete len:102 (-),score=23.01 NODE_2093_length_988_cov_272.527157_g278_i1:400-705(-)